MGDPKLKAKAVARKIEVYGVIYIYDCLVKEGLVAPNIAADHLSELFNLNHWLPEREITQRIAKWGNNNDNDM